MADQSNSRRRAPMKSGDEVDALTRWRHVLFWKPGERKAVKRSFNRRERREALKEARNDT